MIGLDETFSQIISVVWFNWFMKSQECFEYNSSFVVTIGPVLPKKNTFAQIQDRHKYYANKNYSLFGFSAAKEKKNPHAYTKLCAYKSSSCWGRFCRNQGDSMAFALIYSYFDNSKTVPKNHHKPSCAFQCDEL